MFWELSSLLSSEPRLGAEWEHAINRLVGHRFRALLTADVGFEL